MMSSKDLLKLFAIFGFCVCAGEGFEYILSDIAQNKTDAQEIKTEKKSVSKKPAHDLSFGERCGQARCEL